MAWGAKKYCVTCGWMGPPKTITKGSILIEIFLWLFFIVPGILYSLWRLSSRHTGCSSCGSTQIVPLESPRARQALAQMSGPPPLT